MSKLYTFEDTRAGYLALWQMAKLLPVDHDKAVAIARRIADTAHRPAFDAVEKVTGVPWFVVGCLLYRESDLDLNTYLGNGEPLSRVTHLVPAGRGPFTGPNAFLNGAVDALSHEGMTGITDWSIERVLYWCERFNGQGYFNKGNSPYIWSWTDQYHGGLFTGDGIYSASTVDSRPGVAALLKALAEIYPDIAKAITAPITQPTATAPIIPAPKETTPMATTTAVAPVTITDPIPQIIAFLELAKKYLPMVVGFIPAPFGAVATAAVPIVEEVLQLIEDAKTKSGIDLFQTIGAHIEAIGQKVQSTAATAAQVTVAPTAPTSGMPNS